MSHENGWRAAMDGALAKAQRTQRRWAVYGYRVSGRWYYGVSVPIPKGDRRQVR